MTVQEAFDTYRRDVIQFGNQSLSTERHHGDTCKALLAFLKQDMPIRDLSFEHVRKWRNHMELKRCSSGTIYGYIVRLRCVLKHMAKLNEPCLSVEDIKPPRRIKRAPGFLTEEEVSQLIITAAHTRGRFRAKRNAAMLALLYSSGIRVSELVHLNITDVHYDTFVVFGKGGKSRPCFIDARARKYLDEYLKHRKDYCDALFISELYKERMSISAVQEILRGIKERAGISKKVTPHVFRHSFSTNFLRNNGNMRYLQAMLGHESLDTTQMYAQVVDEDLRAIHTKFHSIEVPILQT